MAAIPGGCGVPSHTLGILQTSYSALCLHCSSTIRSGDEFYFCHQCGHTSCVTCAGRTTYNAPNPMKLRRAQQQRPPPQTSRGRQSAQRRAVGAAESSPSSRAGSSPSSRAGSPPSSSRGYLYEVTDSDDDDERNVLRPRRMVNVAQSSRASPLERLLYEADVSADDGEDDKNQLVIACPGSTSHELQFLKKSPYHQSGCFGCNMCKKAVYRDLYHCETCQFDAHKACAEIEMQVKILPGRVRGDIRPWIYKCHKCPNFAVHARCAKYTKPLKHKAHPHKLNLVQNPAIGNSPDFQCDGCGNSIHQGYHYTCTDESCDFDLHPLCAILPSKPLCRLNPTHRVKMDYQALGSEQCALCSSQAKKTDWMYRCGVCDTFMHIYCVNAESSDDELSDYGLDLSESDEEDELTDELYARFVESMESIKSMRDFCAQDNEEQVDKLSELAGSFKSHTEATSLARQRSATSRVHSQISTRAQSKMHTLDHGFANMSLGGSSRPEIDRRSNAAGEEERRRANKQADKEQRQKDKAAARASEDRKKAARREEKARKEELRDTRMQNIEKFIEIQRQSGSNNVATAQHFAELKADLDNKHLEVRSGQREIIRTQVHSTRRAVPRLVLCTETKNRTRKLLTDLKIGLKGVQLHLMCEHEGQEHLVAGASGCEINQKVAGDRWTNLQPFLTAGLHIVTIASNFAGMDALTSVLPDFHQMLWDYRAIDLGNHAISTGPNKRAPKQDEQADEAAAEWLISYLNDQKIDIADNFKLYRVRYEAPHHKKPGTIAWLCQEHLDLGRKAKMLKRYPVGK